MPEARVNRILAPSFLDGPGSRMTFFLQGCNLRCLHCHNPETWQTCTACAQCLPACAAGALGLDHGRIRHDPGRCLECDRCLEACPSHASPRCRVLDLDQAMAAARAWAPYLDGITFSGGECTLQWEFLLAIIPRLQSELGLTVLLDTNGEMAPAVLEGLLGVADGFLFDVKTLDPAAHLALTGVANAGILANLRRAAAARKVVEVRTVLIPGLTDDPALVLAVARLVADLGPAVSLRLTPFRPQGVRGVLAEVPELSPERFEALCAPARVLLGPRLLGHRSAG